MFFKKIIIVLIVVASLLMQLTSCIKTTFKHYMHDKSEINCIELVEADYDSHQNKPIQHLVYKIDDIQAFLNELEEIGYTLFIGSDPLGIDRNTLAIKISYNNGDYEIFNRSAKSSYFCDSDCYYIYMVCGSFDSEFDSLLSKYIARVEDPVFHYLHDKSLVSSIEIAKKYHQDEYRLETIAVVEDVADFYSSLESIPYVHDIEYGGVIDDGSLVIKINYANGDYEMFTHCLSESYTKELDRIESGRYIGNFEETAFNALMQKYIDMNNN